MLTFPSARRISLAAEPQSKMEGRAPARPFDVGGLTGARPSNKIVAARDEMEIQ
jgi:hypothetical protein